MSNSRLSTRCVVKERKTLCCVVGETGEHESDKVEKREQNLDYLKAV